MKRIRVFHLALHARWLLVVVCLLLASKPLGAESRAPRLTQIQAARQFLLAVLRGEFDVAHRMLAPEVGSALTPTQFRAVAQPLYEQGRRLGPAIDLYKLGFRLRDGQAPQSFVAFMFKADTLTPRPRMQLDVTFRDSTARQVLSFGLIPLAAPVR
ncbi:hypothetical protein [Hymenobacter volaticus]|uniref:DUF3887 domain-containing protein n=1 Tax=Hymenobacter volaticus TaxID=2932254 RepID=A0ABY4G4D3_9BACT|nr:hypothetical protein [Hymenobacter volaticus]UOQ65641.1 hypothetical protein MUN86_19195 [Hymenobacter volaticus]